MNPDDCLHQRLDYDPNELVCRDCGWRMPRLDPADHARSWIAHIRDVIAAAPKPASITTPPRLRPKGTK